MSENPDDEKTFEDEHVTVWENKKDKEKREKIRDSLKEFRATNPAEAKHINEIESDKQAVRSGFARDKYMRGKNADDAYDDTSTHKLHDIKYGTPKKLVGFAGNEPHTIGREGTMKDDKGKTVRVRTRDYEFEGEPIGADLERSMDVVTVLRNRIEKAKGVWDNWKEEAPHTNKYEEAYIEHWDAEEAQNRNEAKDYKRDNEKDEKNTFQENVRKARPKKVIGLSSRECSSCGEKEDVPITAELTKAHVKTTPNTPAGDAMDDVAPVTGPRELKPLKPIGRENETEAEADRRKAATYNQGEPREQVDPLIADLARYANRPDVFEAQVNELRQQVIAQKKRQKAGQDRGYMFRNLVGAQSERRVANRQMKRQETNRQADIANQLQQLTDKAKELISQGGSFGQGTVGRKNAVVGQDEQGNVKVDEKVLNENATWQEFDAFLNQMKSKYVKTERPGAPKYRNKRGKEVIPVYDKDGNVIGEKDYSFSPKEESKEEAEEKRKKVTVKKPAPFNPKVKVNTVKTGKKGEATKIEAEGGLKEPEHKKSSELQVGDEVTDISRDKVTEKVVRGGKGKRRFALVRPVLAEDVGGVDASGKQTGVLQDSRYEYKHEGARAPRSGEDLVTILDPSGESHKIQKPAEGYHVKFEIYGRGKNKKYKFAGLEKPEAEAEKKTHRIKDEADLARLKRELAPFIDVNKEKEKKVDWNELRLNEVNMHLDELAHFVATGKWKDTVTTSSAPTLARREKKHEEEAKKGKEIQAKIDAASLGRVKGNIEALKRTKPKFNEEGKQILERKEGKSKFVPRDKTEQEAYNKLGEQMQALKDRASKPIVVAGKEVGPGRIVQNTMDKLIDAYMEGNWNFVQDGLLSLKRTVGQTKWRHLDKDIDAIQHSLGQIKGGVTESKVKGETPKLGRKKNAPTQTPEEDNRNAWLNRAKILDDRAHEWKDAQAGVGKKVNIEAQLQRNQQDVFKEKAKADTIRLFERAGLLPKSPKDMDRIKLMNQYMEMLLKNPENLMWKEREKGEKK